VYRSPYGFSLVIIATLNSVDPTRP